MDPHGAFPGWLNQLWWVLMPGVLPVAAIGLAVSVYLPRLAERAEDRATGLGVVAGGANEMTGLFLVSWLAVSVVLIHLWLLLAGGFAVTREAHLRPGEKWKLIGVGLALFAIYSPILLVLLGQLGLFLQALTD